MVNRASVLQSAEMSLIPLLNDTNNNNNGIQRFSIQHKADEERKKCPSLLALPLGKVLNRILHLCVKDRW